MSQPTLVAIFGRLGAEPELKYTRKQEPVCTLSIAENIVGKEKPKWHKVKVWGQQGENCKVNLKKGQQVFVQGRSRISEYELQGEKKKSIEVMADSVGLPL